jgi:hypothetical protein
MAGAGLFFESGHYEAMSPMEARLFEDMLMDFHSTDADVKRKGNVLVPHTLLNQFQNPRPRVR